MKHTPTPWKFGLKVTDEVDESLIYGANNEMLFSLDDEGFGFSDQEKANAEYIIQCVNSHDELLELVKEGMNELLIHTEYQEDDLFIQRFKKAIQKAEGK